MAQEREWKIDTWNVNGVRASWGKGLKTYLAQASPTVLCLQEIKATPGQLNAEILNPLDAEGRPYHAFWAPAQKLGYSGTAILTREQPDEVRVGMGLSEFDQEGRLIGARFNKLWVWSAYFPNAQPNHARLPYKLKYNLSLQSFLWDFVKQGYEVVLSGDYNVAHQEIDLRNPKQNMNNSGFLPEEREWMTQFLGSGFVDAFRLFETGGGHYTWWSYRPGVRAKNIGWRIDYHCVSPRLKDQVKKVQIFPEVFGSDHCPVRLELTQ